MSPTAPHSTWIAGAGRAAALLVVLWLATRVVTGVLAGILPDPPDPLDAQQLWRFCAAFAAFFLPILYAVPCLLAGRWLRPDPATVLLYAGTAYFFGCALEVTMDPAFVLVLGRPCYLYRVWPLHGGATSGSGLVMWPMYGFFVSQLHHAIHRRPGLQALSGHWARAALLAVDAMWLEVAANLFALVGFGAWMFRYHAPDLHHFTTVEAFPIYLLGGYPGVRILAAAEHWRWRGVLGAGLWLAALGLAFGLDGRLDLMDGG